MNRTMEHVRQQPFKSDVSASLVGDSLLDKFLLIFHKLRIFCQGDDSIAPRQIKVVERVSLGGRRSLTLVSCGGRQFLVGCGPEQVNSIVVVADSESKCL